MGQQQRRIVERRTTHQQVRCRSSRGGLPEAWLVDLAEYGCQVLINGGQLKVGEAVTVRPAGLEGLAGVVRWIDGHRAGIEFIRPLYPSVVDHLLSTARSTQAGNFGKANAASRRTLGPPTVAILRSVA